MNLVYKKMKSPVGELTLIALEAPPNHWKLSAVLWKNDERLLKQYSLSKMSKDEKNVFLTEVENHLSEYFEGKRTAFSLPLNFTGTDFQNKIWKQLLKIPFGKTISYGALAKKAGFEGAFRATGATVGRNPLSIIVPCHRVIGSNGALTGFAGGLKTKVFLLKHEGFDQN